MNSMTSFASVTMNFRIDISYPFQASTLIMKCAYRIPAEWW
jgi:hypothetical protein